tara:strand:- start:569 stop:2722 length:2154 start_codon:yes stop_codon:yes gene_type:complete
MIIDKLERNLLLFLFILLLAYPSLNDLPINGLPFDTLSELFLFLLAVVVAHSVASNNKIFLYLCLLALLSSKVILSLSPTTYWETCFSDNLAPTTQQFEYEDIEVDCEKDFSLIRTEFSGYEPTINFYSIDETQGWRGANNSTFPLSFLNSKKFNFDRTNEPRRDWLPFEATFSVDIESEIRYMRVDYVGEVSVNYHKTENIYQLPDSYELEESKIIEIPKGSDEIRVEYAFNKAPPILWDNALQEGYPKDPYAKIIIYGSTDQKEWSLLTGQESELLAVGVLIFTGTLLSLFLLFLFYQKSNVSSNLLLNVSYIIFLFYLFLNIDLVRGLPKIGFFDITTFFLVSLVGGYLILLRKKIYNFLLLIFCFLMNLLLVDYPWDKLDFYIRPGGSDALTYESQARLIMLGDTLRGGEDIFFYSPGYRYVLSLIHIFFGDTWFVAWYSLISLSLYFFLKTSSTLLSSESYLKYIFPLLGFVYITSNAVQRVFLYGMSEIVSTLILCGLFCVFLLKQPLSQLSQVFIGIIFGIAIVVRPDWLFGFVGLLLLKTFRTRALYLSTSAVSLLPLLHNFVYGKEIVIFSTAASYGRNLLIDSSSISNLVSSLSETVSRNIPYLLMNPLNSDVSGRVGIILPLVFSLILISLIVLFFVRVKNHSDSQSFIFLLSIIGFFIPFFIYDPVLFYPRHVLGAHITAIFFLIYLISPISKDFSFRVVTKERI